MNEKYGGDDIKKFLRLGGITAAVWQPASAGEGCAPAGNPPAPIAPPVGSFAPTDLGCTSAVLPSLKIVRNLRAGSLQQLLHRSRQGRGRFSAFSYLK